MPTNKHLTDLIINKVESQAVYDYMVENNLINDDELYLVEGKEVPATFYVIPGTTTIQEIVDAHTAGTLCLVAKQDSEGNSRVLVLTNHSYIESTGVHNFTFSSVEGQNGILYYWTTFGTVNMTTIDRDLVERPLQLDEEIFLVEYGKTSYADINNALLAGKMVAAPAGFSDNSIIYFILHNKAADGTFYFYSQYNFYTIIYFTLTSNGTYSSLYTASCELSSSRVSTINDDNKDSNAKYPTVGAVTTYIDNIPYLTDVLGINGLTHTKSGRTASLSVGAGNGITVEANSVSVNGHYGITVDENGVSVKPSTGMYVSMAGVGVTLADKTLTVGTDGFKVQPYHGLESHENYGLKVKAGTGITVDDYGVHNAGVRTVTQDTTDGHKLTVNTGGTNATITIPDKDTTYTAGTGLKLTGTRFDHSNAVTAGTTNSGSASGNTITIPKITYDAQGHITKSETASIILPVMTTTEIDTICGGTLDAYLESIAAEGVAF